MILCVNMYNHNRISQKMEGLRIKSFLAPYSFNVQLCCEWEKALEVATKNDRVHLRNTHHSYAKYLEARGKYKDAMHHFELSGTHR